MEILGFGINGPELVVILLVIAVVLGPKHMMSAIRWFAKAVAWIRFKLDEAKNQYSSNLQEVGLDGISSGELTLESLDPRNLIREAVNKELANMQKQIEAQVKAQQEQLAKSQAELAQVVAATQAAKSQSTEDGSGQNTGESEDENQEVTPTRQEQTLPEEASENKANAAQSGTEASVNKVTREMDEPAAAEDYPEGLDKPQAGGETANGEEK